MVAVVWQKSTEENDFASSILVEKLLKSVWLRDQFWKMAEPLKHKQERQTRMRRKEADIDLEVWVLVTFQCVYMEE